MKNVKDLSNCPNCGVSWDAGSILETFIQHRDSGRTKVYDGMSDEDIEKDMKKHYAPPYRWGRLIGVELAYDHPNHYDGVSYWRCPDCKTMWDRWTGEISKEKI